MMAVAFVANERAQRQEAEKRQAETRRQNEQTQEAILHHRFAQPGYAVLSGRARLLQLPQQAFTPSK